MEDTKKIQIPFLQMEKRNNVYDEKYTGWYYCKLCTGEEKVDEFEDIAKENTQKKIHRRKKTKKKLNRESLSYGTLFKKPNTH